MHFFFHLKNSLGRIDEFSFHWKNCTVSVLFGKLESWTNNELFKIALKIVKNSVTIAKLPLNKYRECVKKYRTNFCGTKYAVFEQSPTP